MKKYLIFLLVFNCYMYAQVKPPREYVISHWNLDEGLPQSTVNTVIQTSDGYIWLATFGGLVRFNGDKFTVFDRSNSPGMQSDRVTCLFEDGERGLWISTEKGIILYKNNIFKTFTQNDGFPDGVTGIVHQDKSGTIWVSTADSIYKFINNRFVAQKVVFDNLLRQRAINGEADFWIANSNNVICLIDGKPVFYINMALYTKTRIMDAATDKNGTLWVVTNDDGLFKFINNKCIHYTVKDGLATNSNRIIFIDRDGDIWITGRGGISRISPGAQDKIYAITREDGLSDSDIIDITQDNEGNYWVGTVTGGLNKLRKSIITFYGENQGLANDKLLSLCYRKNGTLLMGTNYGGIYELKNGKINYSSINKYLKSLIVWSVFEDSKQRIWTGAGDIVLIDGNKVTYFNPKRGPKFSFVFAIYEDRNGTIWFGSDIGLFYYSNNNFDEYLINNSLSIKDTRAIFEDKEGNLWIGTTNGLYKIKDNKTDFYTSIGGPGTNYIRAIYQDKEGVLWFGSYGGGIVRYKNNKFKAITAKDGLFDNIVSHLVEDDSGYFWMGSNRGISRVSRKGLNDFAKGLSQPSPKERASKTPFPLGRAGDRLLYVTSFGKPEGLVSVETNGGFQPSAVKDINGKIYFPTVSGLAVVDPGKVILNEKIPEVHIENILISGKETGPSLQQTVSISYDSNDIQIQYAALSYIDNKKVKFKYKINGYDKDWVDAESRRSAYYTKLPPGEYTFTVIASNNDGKWNTKGASVSFIILPPFWMTWWFYTIIFSITVLSIILVVRYVSTRKLKQKLSLLEKEHAIIKERERISRDLHDEIGSRVTQIALYSGLLSENSQNWKKTEWIVDNIQESTNNIVTSLDEVVWAVNPKNDNINDFAGYVVEYTGAFIKKSGLEFTCDVPGLLPEIKLMSETRHAVLMVIKEALANIVKHSGASRVTLVISYQDNGLSIFISDNGKGFIEENVRRFSNGLKGMRSRIEDISGIFELISEAGMGTKIKIKIPLNRIEQ